MLAINPVIYEVSRPRAPSPHTHEPQSGKQNSASSSHTSGWLIWAKPACKRLSLTYSTNPQVVLSGIDAQQEHHQAMVGLSSRLCPLPLHEHLPLISLFPFFFTFSLTSRPIYPNLTYPVPFACTSVSLWGKIRMNALFLRSFLVHNFVYCFSVNFLLNAIFLLFVTKYVTRKRKVYVSY